MLIQKVLKVGGQAHKRFKVDMVDIIDMVLVTELLKIVN